VNCFLNQERGRFVRMLFVCSVNLFYYHNGVINDQSNGCGYGTKRHDVKCVANCI